MSMKHFDREADRYDSTVRFTQDQYDFAHSVLAHIAGELAGDSPLTVLNLGSGTGVEAARLCSQAHVKHIVLLDSSDQMHPHARRRMSRVAAPRRPERFYVTANMCQAAQLVGELPSNLQRDGSFDLIVSALSLHHLTAPEKADLYAECFRLLTRRGALLNLDLFKHESAAMETIARAHSIAWLYRHLDKPDWTDAHVDRWRAHIEDENDPLEIGLPHKPSKKSEISLLMNAGFTDFAVPYRHYELALLVARKK